MVDIDKMRIAAVCALEALGYRFDGVRWLPAINWSCATMPMFAYGQQ
jgi:hypothetical protein